MDVIEISKLAVETGFWPLYEVDHGVVKVTHKPSKRKPIEEWLKSQGRYKHLFKPGNEHLIGAIQESIDIMWEKLDKGILI